MHDGYFEYRGRGGGETFSDVSDSVRLECFKMHRRVVQLPLYVQTTTTLMYIKNGNIENGDNGEKQGSTHLTELYFLCFAVKNTYNTHT